MRVRDRERKSGWQRAVNAALIVVLLAIVQAGVAALQSNFEFRVLNFAFAAQAPAKAGRAAGSGLTIAAPQDWPQFRGTPDLTGQTAAALSESLGVAWTYEAGDAIESSAAIADGVVYVGTQKGELLAIDLESGKLRWKYSTKEPIGESSPAVANGIVYVGDYGGMMHAVDARDGKAVWTFRTQAEIKSSPVVHDDRVMFGSYDQFLYAVNPRTGAIVWKVETDGQVHATPSVRDGVVYISGCDGKLRAIRIRDGVELYAVNSGGYTGASPAILGARAFFGTFENDVIGVDLAAKRVLWRYKNPTRDFPFYSSAALTEDRVILGGRDKIVHAIDQATGKGVWTFTTRARVDSSPAIASGRVYIGSNDGRLYALSVADGKKVWEFEAGSPISASPAIARGRLVVGTQDGRLYCFK